MLKRKEKPLIFAVCPVCFEKTYYRAEEEPAKSSEGIQIHQCSKHGICGALFATGLYGYSAAVVQHSRAWHGQDIITFRARYPRLFHAELGTHRMLSRNSASSRAIPVKRQIQMIKDQPATFVHWGRNRGGMSADEEVTGWQLFLGQLLWNKVGVWFACTLAWLLNWLGFHKQIVNRCLEPWMFMETILTATDFENMFWLRDHKAAQPEFRYLAKMLVMLRNQSVPEEILEHGEWHVPYVYRHRDKQGKLCYYTGHKYSHKISLELAKNLSASCVAQVSFMRLDNTLEKAEKVVGRLMGEIPVHASPLEAQATPMSHAEWDLRNQVVEGFSWAITAPQQLLYCGNLRGFIQARKYIQNENLTARYPG